MTTNGLNQFTKNQKKLSLRSALGSALGVAVLGTSFFLAVGVNKSHAGIIESTTENFNRGQLSLGPKGEAGCQVLEQVTTFMDHTTHPVRGGQYAFRHLVNRCGERAELGMKKTVIGSTYWYGWSVFIPSDWSDNDPGFDILAQWPIYPSAPNRQLACGADGSYMTRNQSEIIFKIQHKGEKADTECNNYSLAQISDVRGKWIDFVINVKWTGNKDGFLKLWTKSGNGQYTQKVDYKGRTFWNDESTGPFFKMGLYKGDPNFKGPAPRYLYTDEYRLGDSNSSFEEVSPH